MLACETTDTLAGVAVDTVTTRSTMLTSDSFTLIDVHFTVLSIITVNTLAVVAVETIKTRSTMLTNDAMTVINLSLIHI